MWKSICGLIRFIPDVSLSIVSRYGKARKEFVRRLGGFINSCLIERWVKNIEELYMNGWGLRIYGILATEFGGVGDVLGDQALHVKDAGYECTCSNADEARK